MVQYYGDKTAAQKAVIEESRKTLKDNIAKQRERNNPSKPPKPVLDDDSDSGKSNSPAGGTSNSTLNSRFIAAKKEKGISESDYILLLQYFNNNVTAAQNMIINSNKRALDNYIEIQRKRNRDAGGPKPPALVGDNSETAGNSGGQNKTDTLTDYLYDVWKTQKLLNTGANIKTGIYNSFRRAKKITDKEYEGLVKYYGSEKAANNALANLSEAQLHHKAELGNWKIGTQLDTDSMTWAGGYINPELKVEYAGREEIMDKAYEYANYEWTPLEKISGWNGGITYEAGQTYYGVPYSQHGHSTPEAFSESIDSYGFNDEYVRESSDGTKVTMPRYGQDCSGFVSDTWGLNRMSTGFMMEAADRGVFETKDDYSQLKPGDAVLKDGHVRLVVHVEGNRVYTIEQTTADGAYGTHLDYYSFDELKKNNYIPITKFGMDEEGYKKLWDEWHS